MSDPISRADAIEAVASTKPIVRSTERNWGKMIAEQHSKELVKAIKALPSADAVSREEYEEVKAYMDTLVDAFIEDGEELAESVKVVRCKNCRWYENRYGEVCHNPRYGDGHANYSPPYVDEEYFCKDGERREL